MNFDFNSETPIYIQIAKELEDAVFTGIYGEETQIPSTTELSVTLKINPATVLKGMNILVSENIIYKKRGVGMFVCKGAREIIIDKRRVHFIDDYIIPLMREAEKLGLTEEEIKQLLERGYKNGH